MYLMDFGKRLRCARKRSGLQAVHAAERIGVTADTITRYESGRIFPTIDKVFVMANLYGVSVDWLCGMEVVK
jgi:transcriptional regulator with XRE-family HTH domain